MAKPRKAWRISPLKKPKTPLSDLLKAEVDAKAADLIENVLKPKHVLPPLTRISQMPSIGVVRDLRQTLWPTRIP